MSDAYINVCAAVLLHEGKLLLTTRRPGGHLAGCWEFPGGKVNADETLEACIVRELKEELALFVNCAGELFSLAFDYPEKSIRLHFMLCELNGASRPIPQEQQAFGWFTASQAIALELASADELALNKLRACADGAAAMEGLNVALAADLLAFMKLRDPLENAKMPDWLHISVDGGKERMTVRELVKCGGLNTVCESAKCPNRCDCWKRKTATFMILGDTCTRNCRFCAVKHGVPTAVDESEPERIARSVADLGLKYAVLTCVTRDDLPDGGAGMMAATVAAIRKMTPETQVEVLCSDYKGDFSCIEKVMAAGPVVYGHNVETVERLTPAIRSRADYRRSLAVLKYAAEFGAKCGVVAKSGLMLGLGESDDEIRQTLKDLREAGVEIVTLGQYLRPTRRNWPVQKLVTPDEFRAWQEYAEKELGFRKAVAGPFVRSSYMAEEAFNKVE